MLLIAVVACWTQPPSVICSAPIIRVRDCLPLTSVVPVYPEKEIEECRESREFSDEYYCRWIVESRHAENLREWIGRALTACTPQ